MKIAYLMNQHPYPSCTFIRREILGVEESGIEVVRFSIRPPEQKSTDAADQKELTKTRFILGEGVLSLFQSLFWAIFTQPLRFIEALKLTFKIGWRSDRGLLINLAYLLEACMVRRWCKQLSIEHIHAHFGNNPAAVAMLCHVLGGPSYSFTVHGPHDFDKPEAIALPDKIQRAAFVVGVSSFGKSQLFRWCDYKQWAKIHIIHCGVDDLFLSPPDVPIPKEPRFVCVGRLGEQKGHLLLVEAISQLAAEGLQFKMVFVGDGPLRGQIEHLIRTLKLQNHIEITGWATNAEVQQQILNSQVMVLPSFAEGLPVAIMESLALCRPVLSTYIAGIPELIEPGQTGWLVPAGSVDALAAGLRAVMETPIEQLEQMGKNGAERVVKNHNASQEASKLATLIQNVCQAHPHA
jgi:colanic acid/amylovoran biosynthesis glycosyltransferase